MRFYYIGLLMFIALILLTLFLYLNPYTRNAAASAGACEAYCSDHINNVSGNYCFSNNLTFGFACEVSNGVNVCNNSHYIMLNRNCQLLKIS